MHLEMVLFFKAMGLGVLLILGYDLFVALRRVLPHHPAVVACEDFGFWLIVAFVSFAGVYRTNQGILRSFLLLGMVLGAILCRNIASPLFVKTAEVILGIPVVFAKFLINRLLFLVKRCKIYRYKFANFADRKKKARVLRMKRSRQVEKVRERKGQKNNE